MAGELVALVQVGHAGRCSRKVRADPAARAGPAAADIVAAPCAVDRHPRGRVGRGRRRRRRAARAPPAAAAAARGDRRGRRGAGRAVRGRCRARARATWRRACCRCGPTSPTYEMPNDDPEALERRVRVDYPVARRPRARARASCPTLRLQRALATPRAHPRAARRCSCGRTGSGSWSRTAPSPTCCCATASASRAAAALIYAMFDLGADRLLGDPDRAAVVRGARRGGWATAGRPSCGG